MNTECVDLRRGERFIVIDPLAGTFGPADVVVMNLSLGGMQLMHAVPLRIGTRGKITFRHGGAVVATAAQIVWSRAVSTDGKLVYYSGIKLDAPDGSYALAMHSLLKSGVLRQDLDSLDKKRVRLEEREKERASQTRLRAIPPSELPPA